MMEVGSGDDESSLEAAELDGEAGGWMMAELKLESVRGNALEMMQIRRAVKWSSICKGIF